MTDIIGGWIAGLAGTALLTGIALSVTPKGSVYRILRLVCGVVMVVALISPVLSLDIGILSVNAAYYREQLGDLQGKVTEASDKLSRTIIEEECVAYILDKAQVFELEVGAVTVTAKWGDEGWFYPYEMHIEAVGSEEKKALLARAVEGELGITRERQYWDGKEG